ncbi:LysR family transcriptional regulator [bacterium]|nr:LysR family transcriptional regulator [bacterium]
MSQAPSELKYFVEVANTLNFSRAAERLGITQPALSQAVQRLEKSVGGALFVRTRTGVQLTRSGTKLYARGRQLLTQWEDLVRETQRDESELRGTYSVGCHPSVALYTLGKTLPELLTAHPDLSFSLTHDLSRKITERVIGFGLDFGIVINPVRHPGLVIRKLGGDTVRLWTREDPTPLQRLGSGQEVLICDPELSQTQDIHRRLGSRGTVFQRQIASSNLEVIASLVASGAGIGVLPGRVANRIAEYRLTPVEGDLPTYADTVCLIYRSDTHGTVAAKQLARALAHQLQGV